ncbi:MULTISPECIES: MarR family winged helix-turn-helix transcriptional regulator [Rhodococcus]|uniref:MarR family winged helix-turn-helix transcriptional regulator n=1 Tax=Rhodococcus oxybenzonivorans TaxID=1990687 RepID=A0AAE4V173_9NOCA|nr:MULTISPECIES: MarR family winged helix-turn-helix transcriptional regulator [Rhodococcus]MDV7245743.1 MarR family winged helix-turn-helix transcriptional regulator [Rhodococcus oxybenzonivorans]MDV7266951.1 MarR family winged helix-turn-helix transcriptional regulator [Rhodococcus oxybenzonivorans]MDV7276902.1 MarR family winged helix-turn-helix transcriptional regulator [Rhodococcus oxybenzonivorans]MDV7336766.1 MarR family winged helix-turn-helix transcriptional regulator [Rhodococcus oxyb
MTVSDREAVTADIENELTLLSRHYVHSQRAGLQIDRSAYLLLSRLELEHPVTLKELSEAFRLDISTINRQIGALLRRGLVERVPDPDGGLARKVQATDLGLEHLRSDRQLSRSGVERVIGGWSDGDREELRRLLSKFNAEVENLEGRSWPRRSKEGRLGS